MTRRGWFWLTSGAAALAAGGGTAYAAFSAAMVHARARIEGRSRVFASRAGQMEYAIAGKGPPVLMIHGTGGGFDQGLAFARPLSEKDWSVIAPSRFGYLRSDFPADVSIENQADAFIDLLDHLGIERLPVIGGSAGALSALAFAIRHPSRCSALVTVVPATHVPGRPPVRPDALGAAIMAYGLQSDFLFWLGMMLAEDRMIATLLATDPDLVTRAPDAERARVRNILHEILPVSARSRGLLNDGLQAGDPPPLPIERITAPTLAISAKDDRFGTAAAASHIAASVPGAQLILYPTGGHVWVGHDAELWAAVDGFLRRP